MTVLAFPRVDPIEAAREHVAHAIAQNEVDATVTVTANRNLRVDVDDPVARHSLAQVVTDGRQVTREVIYSAQPYELLTGWSRFDPTYRIQLVGPLPRRAA